MEIGLDKLEHGMRGVVTRIGCGEALSCRLRAFGLVDGTEVALRYRSPDGGVTALELRGTVVALRTRELKKIRVRLV